MAHIPFLELSGTPETRGRVYGHAFQERIRATWRLYADTLFATSKLSRTQIIARAAKVRELVGDFNAEYCQEIEAIASAAGLEAWEVYALNARTEILNATVGECTALCMPQARVLGQTWDWIEPLEELMVVTKSTREDGHQIMTLAEPGQLAKIGMNSAGIGVCLNFLVAPHPLEGVPVHILIRAMLDCRSLEEISDMLKRAGEGKASHFLIADAHGAALSIEFEGTQHHVLKPLDGLYAHTNHCIAPAKSPTSYVIPTSSERLQSARQLAAQGGANSVDDLKRILDFDDDSKGSIRVRYRPEPLLGGSNVGSCATVIMELAAQRMHIKKGPELGCGYTTYIF